MPYLASAEEKQFNRQIGEKLRQHRIRLGLSQDSVAASIGVTYQQIQRYEKGQGRMPAARLNQLSCLLQVPLSDFFAKAVKDEEMSQAEAELLRAFRAMRQSHRDTLADIAYLFVAH